MSDIRQKWTKWAGLVGGMASVAVLITTVGDFSSLRGGVPAGEAESQYGFEPWRSGDDLADMEDGLPPEPPEEMAFWVHLVDEDDAHVDARVILGAPGMWPFVSTDTKNGGYLSLPVHEAQTMDGRDLRMYEVLARSPSDVEEPWGFWGLVRGPQEEVSAADAQQLRMSPGHPLNVEVLNDDGEPVEGAFVRLSRDSIGLVHLNVTTLDDGQASFRAIPAGTYYLTIDADHHRRTTARVQHSGVSELPLEVTLEDGGGLRLPQSWRGPPVPELAAAGSTGSSGGQSGGSAGSAESEQEDEAGHGGQTVALNVLVADSYGGGVNGAWVEAWAGGRRVAQAQSQGRTPARLDVPAGQEVAVVATHSGWGEGEVRLAAPDDGEDLVVRLENETLSRTSAQDRMLRIDDIEDELGVRLVEHRRQLLIELEEHDGPAAQAGVQRGDALMFVRRQGSGHLVVVHRGTEIVEIAVR